MNRRSLIFVIVIVVLFIGVNVTFFAVGEPDQAVVTYLGKPVKVIQQPGLYLKIPFVQQVTMFDRRLLEYDASLAPSSPRTRRPCGWTITPNGESWTPFAFLQTVQTENGAQARLDDIIYSELRVDSGPQGFSLRSWPQIGPSSWNS